jgi:hypothetical protein
MHILGLWIGLVTVVVRSVDDVVILGCRDMWENEAPGGDLEWVTWRCGVKRELREELGDVMQEVC